LIFIGAVGSTVFDNVEGTKMPTSQNGSKSRHTQFFTDEQEELAPARIENDNAWISEFLVRLASVVQNMEQKNRGASRTDDVAL
jgi:hypothetical protein